jgi:hypothetical protein
VRCSARTAKGAGPCGAGSAEGRGFREQAPDWSSSGAGRGRCDGVLLRAGPEGAGSLWGRGLGGPTRCSAAAAEPRSGWPASRGAQSELRDGQRAMASSAGSAGVGGAGGLHGSSPSGFFFDSGLEIKTRSVEQTLLPLVSQVKWRAARPLFSPRWRLRLARPGPGLEGREAAAASHSVRALRRRCRTAHVGVGTRRRPWRRGTEPHKVPRRGRGTAVRGRAGRAAEPSRCALSRLCPRSSPGAQLRIRGDPRLPWHLRRTLLAAAGHPTARPGPDPGAGLCLGHSCWPPGASLLSEAFVPRPCPCGLAQLHSPRPPCCPRTCLLASVCVCLACWDRAWKDSLRLKPDAHLFAKSHLGCICHCTRRSSKKSGIRSPMCLVFGVFLSFCYSELRYS